MFKKYYKLANDDIQPDRTLIDKIFEKAEKTPVVRTRAKIYKLGTAVAAVLVVAISAILYPQIEKTMEKPIVTEELNQEIKVENQSDMVGVATLMPAKKSIAEGEQIESDSTAGENSGIAVAAETLDNAEEFNAFNGTYDENKARTEKKSVENSELSQSADLISEATDEEIDRIIESLYQHFGKTDEETGNDFIFEITGRFVKNLEGIDEIFCLGRWRWWVKDHSSLLCEFVVNKDVTEMYECRLEEGHIIWDETVNLLQK